MYLQIALLLIFIFLGLIYCLYDKKKSVLVFSNFTDEVEITASSSSFIRQATYNYSNDGESIRGGTFLITLSNLSVSDYITYRVVDRNTGAILSDIYTFTNSNSLIEVPFKNSNSNLISIEYRTSGSSTNIQLEKIVIEFE